MIELLPGGHENSMWSKYNSKLYVSIGLGALLISFLISLLFFARFTPKERSALPIAIVDPFDGIALSARAAYVFGMTDGKVLFSLNENEILPLASLTKIMTALTAVDLAPSSTVVTVDDKSIATDGDTGLFSGEHWRLKDLLDFTLVTSSNDGASAIASAIGALGPRRDISSPPKDYFVNEMNLKAKSLGLLNSHFTNENGLDIDETESGAYGSAQDVGKLMEYVLRNKPDLLSATAHDKFIVESLSNISHRVKNTDTILDGIPGVLASKTGYTDLSGGNLTLAFDPGLGHPIILVVLGSTYDGRFLDMLKLQKAAMAKFQQKI